MLEDDYLEKLTLFKLHILLAHVRLGLGHLRRYLDEQRLEECLRLGGVNTDQAEKISSNILEKSGPIILMVNTIFTGAFGAWLGIVGLLELSAENNTLTWITLAACTASIGAGYINYRLIKQQEHAAMQNQELRNLEYKILCLTVEKRKLLVYKAVSYINKLVDGIRQRHLLLTRPPTLEELDLENEGSLIRWCEALTAMIEEQIGLLGKHPAERLCAKKFRRIQSGIRAIVRRPSVVYGECKPHVHACFMDQLVDPETAACPLMPEPRSWLRTNFIKLIVGLVPTVIGGFASLFVYLGNVTFFAKHLGIGRLEELLLSDTAKLMALSLGIMITFSFAITYVYSNRKSFRRTQSIEKTRKMIASEEAVEVAISAKLRLVRKMRLQVQQIKQLCDLLEAL